MIGKKRGAWNNPGKTRRNMDIPEVDCFVPKRGYESHLFGPQEGRRLGKKQMGMGHGVSSGFNASLKKSAINWVSKAESWKKEGEGRDGVLPELAILKEIDSSRRGSPGGQSAVFGGGNIQLLRSNRLFLDQSLHNGPLKNKGSGGVEKKRAYRGPKICAIDEDQVAWKWKLYWGGLRGWGTRNWGSRSNSHKI